MQFVLDCSVAMAWCFEDERNAYVDEVLEALSEWEALVPPIWSLEIINVLLVAECMKKLKEAESAHFLDLLTALPIVEDNQISQLIDKLILSLGREHDLSSYDASYLELAIRRAIPLATQDNKLLKACTKSGVRVFKRTNDKT